VRQAGAFEQAPQIASRALIKIEVSSKLLPIAKRRADDESTSYGIAPANVEIDGAALLTLSR
jgi:hypothetical protein